MAAENARDELLGLLDRIHVSTNRLKNEVTALHQAVRFDHHSSGTEAAARRVETELGRIAVALPQFWDLFGQEQKRTG